MITKISYFLLATVLFACNSKNFSQSNELNQSIVKLNWEQKSQDEIHIFGNFWSDERIKIIDRNGITHLEIGDKKLQLKDRINNFNLSDIYLVDYPGFKKKLAIEYYLLGSSGQMASIIFTSFFSIEEGKPELVFSYTSSLGGVDLLNYDKETLSVSIYKLFINDSKKEEFYCKTDFEIVENKFYPGEFSSCLQGNALLNLEPKEDCNCVPLSTPDVRSISTKK